MESTIPEFLFIKKVLDAVDELKLSYDIEDVKEIKEKELTEEEIEEKAIDDYIHEGYDRQRDDLSEEYVQLDNKLECKELKHD